MKVSAIWFLTLAAVPFAASGAPILNTAGQFSVLAGSTVTNTGPSVLIGNVGVSPGGSITGFPPGSVQSGVFYISESVALQAQSDLTTAYNSAAGSTCGSELSGQDLGGLTLTPGVYCFASSAQLTGALTLDALGDPNAVFVFQIGSSLTTAGSSSVVYMNSGTGRNVFWQVGSSATLGTTSAFSGHILALTSITLQTGASISCGAALARNGGVTLDTNAMSVCPADVGGSEVPEPATGFLVLAFGALFTWKAWPAAARPLRQAQHPVQE